MELLQYFSQDLGKRIPSSLAGFKKTYVDSNPLDREVSRNESNDIHVMHFVAAPGIGRSIVGLSSECEHSSISTKLFGPGCSAY